MVLLCAYRLKAPILVLVEESRLQPAVISDANVGEATSRR
jgi:hypothetical protein